MKIGNALAFGGAVVAAVTSSADDYFAKSIAKGFRMTLR